MSTFSVVFHLPLVLTSLCLLSACTTQPPANALRYSVPDLAVQPEAASGRSAKPGWAFSRQAVAAAYDAAFAQLPGVEIPFRAADSRHVFHQYTLKLTSHSRAALQAHLQAAGIPSMIYYPIPAHRQNMFSKFNLGHLHLPLTEALCEQVISLPIHTEMDEQQLDYIIQHVLSFFK